ncbi:MAG: ABC transporter substrate-binding protein [Anaerolineales bacterium]|nr:ABC transporter substrate-binding protein [Anaerolineales bacterium]
MSRIKYALFVLLVLASLALSACGGAQAPQAPAAATEAPAAAATEAPAAATEAPAQPKDPIKVGAIFDLTGGTADVSTPYSEGVKGYVDWVNANGGVEGHPIDLTSADYAYKVDQAEQLYTQYVSEGVVAFMGWGTGDTEALRTKVAADKLPFMSASYAASLLVLNDAPYNFLVGTSYSDQAIIAARWAMDDWKTKGNAGAPNFVIIHNDSPFGMAPVADAKAYIEAAGGKFIDIAMPKGATDYVAELAQMTTFGANYVIVQNVSSPAAVLLKDAKNQGFGAQFICLNWCADEILVKLAGDAAEGVMGTLPFAPPSSPEAGHADAAAYLQSQGAKLEDKGLHYTQGWWTMAVMVEGMRIVAKEGKEINGENIRAALETITKFDTGGVTSPITFTAESHRGSDALKLFKVEGGKWNAVSDFISAQ